MTPLKVGAVVALAITGTAIYLGTVKLEQPAAPRARRLPEPVTTHGCDCLGCSVWRANQRAAVSLGGRFLQPPPEARQ